MNSNWRAYTGSNAPTCYASLKISEPPNDMNYKEQLDSPQWQRRRLEKMESANWQCQVCGDGNEKLHVHHVRYEDGRLAWQYRDEELQCLCATCHQLAHMNPAKVITNAEAMAMKRRAVYTVLGIGREAGSVTIEEGHPMEREWLKLREEMMIATDRVARDWREKIEAFRAKYSQHNVNVLAPAGEETLTKENDV